MSPDIDLAVFTADLVNHLVREDLTEVVLVGHRFGGNAISGAAYNVPGPLARPLYPAAPPLRSPGPRDGPGPPAVPRCGTRRDRRAAPTGHDSLASSSFSSWC